MLRFCDSFDHYDSAAITEKWTQIISDTGGNPTIGAWGRQGTNGMQLNIGGAGRANRVGLTLTTISGATVIVQFGFRSPSAFANLDVGTTVDDINQSRILNLRQGGTTQVWFRINTNGTISAYQGATLLLTTDVSLQQNVYHYLKFKVLIDGSVGTVAIDIDGVTKSATGLDTQVTGTATVDELHLGSLVGLSSTWQYDDFIVMDATGTAFADLVGDHHASYRGANGAGNYAAWTPAASTNLSQVDEAIADGDTTYNESDTASQRDSFTVNWPASGQIGAVQIVAQARKTDDGASGLTLFTRNGGNDDDGTEAGLTDSYTVVREIMEENPDTAAAWSTSDTPEFGYLKST
jgi:K+-transporting ATPase c subunit